MANLFTAGFESGAISTEQDYSSTTGTVTLETSIVNSGSSAIQAVGTAGNQFVNFRYSGTALPLTTIIYARAYFRMSALPTALDTVFVLIDSSFSGPASLRVTTSGVLQLWDTTTARASTSALSINTWYMIELASQVNSATTGYLEGRLNGTSFGSSSVGTNAGAGLRDLRVGITSGTAPGFTIYFDDISVNDNSGGTNNTWPGAIPTPPVNTVAPVLTGTATRGLMLSSSAGTWTNSPTSYAYQWKRSTDGGSTYSSIAGMTSNAYMLVAADVGNKVRCDVTAINSGGSVPASSLGTAAVASATITVPSLAFQDYKSVNYYPSAAAWQYMWAKWDSAQINADMARMAAMNINLVRCIIPAENTYFGYPTPVSGMTNRIDQWLAIAVSHGLSVYLTLFDKFNTYTDISGSESWASAVLGGFSGDARISFIELQNEIDGTNSTVMTWAQALLPYIRTLMPGTKTTVSTIDPTANFPAWSSIVTGLDSYLDFYTLHLYNKLARAYGTMAACKNALPSGKSFWIGETGFSTDISNTTAMSNLPVGLKSFEYAQEYWYRVFSANCEALGIPKPSPWMILDLTSTAQPGGVDAIGQNYGLLRIDGSEKVAAETIRRYFGTGQYSKEFNNGFETVAENNLPSIWQLNQSGLATFTRDTANPRTGMASGSISASGGSSTLRPSFYTNPPVVTLPGKRYQMSFWAKGTSLTGTTRGYIAWFDGTDTFLNNSNLVIVPNGTSSWTQYIAESVCPATAVYCQIFLESYTNTGQVWFDDVTFEEIKQTTRVLNIGNNSTAYDQRLRWRPPDQVSPTVVTIGTGFYGNTFGANEDVIIIHPSSTRFSAINVTGGRHIRVIAGDNVRSSTGTSFFFQGVSGSVFLEGQNLDTSALSADAVNIFGQTTGPFTYYPDVYIQNCRLMNINGSNAGVHADIFQTVGSMGSLYIDKLTASSNYQGLSLFQKQFPISGNVYISRTNLSYYTGGDPTTYLTWFIDSLTGFTPYAPIYLDQVYVHPRASQNLSQAVAPYPGLADTNSVAIGSLTTDSYASVYFPNASNIHGVIYSGDPPNGDFVPSGTPGYNYVSPGYK